MDRFRFRETRPIIIIIICASQKRHLLQQLVNVIALFCCLDKQTEKTALSLYHKKPDCPLVRSSHSALRVFVRSPCSSRTENNIMCAADTNVQLII